MTTSKLKEGLRVRLYGRLSHLAGGGYVLGAPDGKAIRLSFSRAVKHAMLPEHETHVSVTGSLILIGVLPQLIVSKNEDIKAEKV